MVPAFLPIFSHAMCPCCVGPTGKVPVPVHTGNTPILEPSVAIKNIVLSELKNIKIIHAKCVSGQ
jgi:hypothetical protein